MSNDNLRGDCLTCSRIEACNEVTIDRVKTSYTCPLFSAITEPVYMARLAMMAKYGEDAAIRAMLARPEPVEDDEDNLTPEGEDDDESRDL